MKRRYVLALITILMFSLAGCNAKDSSKEATNMNNQLNTISLNEQKDFQVIEGFGASGAWWAQDIGAWTDDKRKQIIDLLFDNEKGIGLSMYRYNIGAGSGQNIDDPWRKTETFEVSRGKYDFTKDANAIKVLKEVKDKGVQNFIAFSNSPTARMTVSGLVTGGVDGTSNLKPEMYEDYAQYLIDVTKHLIEDEKIPVKWISPINEPQWQWKGGQEGCHYTPEEVAKFSEVFTKKLKESKLDTKASFIDSGEWKSSYDFLDELMKVPGVKNSMDTFAIHSYWSDDMDKKSFQDKLKQSYPGLKLWQSEWTEMTNGRDTSMDSALTMAKVMQEDFTIGQVTSWQYWIAVSKYDYRDGLIYTDDGKQNIIETKRLWTLGNYSKFVKPGFTRIDTESEDSSLKTVCFKDPKTNKIVMVVTNPTSVADEVNLKTIDKHNKMSIYETSEKNNLKNMYSGKVKGSITFAANSVTTVVLE